MRRCFLFYGYNPTYFLVLFLVTLYFTRSVSFKIFRAGLVSLPSALVAGLALRFSKAIVLR